MLPNDERVTHYERFMEMSSNDMAEMFHAFCKQMDGCYGCPLDRNCPYDYYGRYNMSVEEWEEWLDMDERVG